MNVFEAAKAAVPLRKAAECYYEGKQKKEENGYYQEDKIA